MKLLWPLMFLVGAWFLASAVTEEGLLPSGHGVGRWSEVVFGVALIAYSSFRLWTMFRRRSGP